MYATERIRELLANEEGLYSTCLDLAHLVARGRDRAGAMDYLSSRLADLVEGILLPPDSDLHSITRSLVKELMWEVNWNEIADDYLSEVDDSEFGEVDEDEEECDARTYRAEV